MTVLTRMQRRAIEARIRDYWLMRAEIKAWRDGVIHGRKTGAAKKPGRAHADPAAAAAVRLASPPRRVRELQGWVDAVDAVKAEYDATGRLCVFENWFWAGGKSCLAASRAMHVDERTLFRWRSDAVEDVFAKYALKTVSVLGGFPVV